MKAEEMTRIRMVMKDRVQAGSKLKPQARFLPPDRRCVRIVDMVLASDIYIPPLARNFTAVNLAPEWQAIVLTNYRTGSR